MKANNKLFGVPQIRANIVIIYRYIAVDAYGDGGARRTALPNEISLTRQTNTRRQTVHINRRCNTEPPSVARSDDPDVPTEFTVQC
ncbi:hypothetical protein EVAR_7774_1 [Eumeta japonica]|uniref:Uncharacterized protein n=1 Tax=Eumeta variegata TaxID=151549 RepID=A0A4C1TK53_EUMVA|nr:hypothetical protein EVAR_7774_1 [Eumeta japonica]